MAAVVALLAYIKRNIVAELAMAAPICGPEKVNLGLRIHSKRNTAATRLRPHAMAKGFQSTSFIRSPARLQRKAVPASARAPRRRSFSTYIMGWIVSRHPVARQEPGLGSLDSQRLLFDSISPLSSRVRRVRRTRLQNPLWHRRAMTRRPTVRFPLPHVSRLCRWP